jgi:putative ABC transport system substrate-binding protein
VKQFSILDFGFSIGSERKRIFCFAACAVLVVLCSSVEAQQPAKIPRIGLVFASAAGNSARTEAFRQGLRELGYSIGKNIVLEYRYADGKLDRYPIIASELVRLGVDVIVTGGPAATHSVKQATSKIPIVMTQDNDPVGNGFVATLARPGGNITGLSTLGAPISGKQLELLTEIVPGLDRVAVLGTSTEPANPRSLKEVERAAAALRVETQYVDALHAKDLEPAFGAASKRRADAMLVLASAVAASQRKALAELAAKSRLPAIYPQAEFVLDGGLMSYAVSFTDLTRRAAIYVDKILKGTKPADLPVEQATTFEFVINLNAAKQIGLTIPPNVLARANQVIK